MIFTCHSSDSRLDSAGQCLCEQFVEYKLLDFSICEDETEFTKKFVKLVEELDSFYNNK
jgi:hypothetical protein